MFKTFFNWLVGTPIDYSPDAQYHRDAAVQVIQARLWNRRFEAEGAVVHFPEDEHTWYLWYKSGKKLGSNPQIDAAFAWIDPSYMSGTSESEPLHG